jgi:hypothetical protein
MLTQRGRKSSLKLPLVAGREPKLPPPPHLGAAEAALWNEIVASHGAAYFNAGNTPLLEQFCMLSIAARKPDMAQRERIQTALCTAKLASAMRLSQFSALRKPQRKPYVKPIWEAE